MKTKGMSTRDKGTRTNVTINVDINIINRFNLTSRNGIFCLLFYGHFRKVRQNLSNLILLFARKHGVPPPCFWIYVDFR